MTKETLCAYAEVDLRAGNPLYRDALEASAGQVRDRIGDEAELVLLGSIATPKYVDILTTVFGERLRFPKDFVGRGDMSRGALMLQCVREGRELEYIPVAGSVRTGRRAPRIGN